MNAWSKGIRLAHCRKKWKNTSINSEEEKKNAICNCENA
jgi:hypothetical protein